MTAHYPNGPSSLPDDFVTPSPSYKSQARVAFASLLLFMGVYLGACVWFIVRAYRNLMPNHGPGNVFVGVACGVMALFLIKGLFFRIRQGATSDLEIQESEQPELFAFLYDIADKVGAPRPYRVFVSPDVNASVSYDLSPINLLIPSRKNLRIGLGLVNSLNRSEFRAVLAHEFGHFAQESMKIGTWVYQAQAIAQNIVAKRDWFDSSLRWISRIDIRIAWVGWCLRLFVWSIRSVIESFFRWVILAERALSRQMEFQADLVSVSLCGSDALINGLHRTGPADRSWNAAVNIVSRQIGEEVRIPDLFLVQSMVLKELSRILQDPQLGESPASHNEPEKRVFSHGVAQSPQMWSTHPSNVDREENAKRRFVYAEADERSAWTLFHDAEALREQSTSSLFTEESGFASLPRLSPEEVRILVQQEYIAPSLDEKYGGFYLGRNPVLLEKDCRELLASSHDGDLLGAAVAFYDQNTCSSIEELQRAESDYYALEAIHLGFAEAPGGVIRHKDQVLSKKSLPEVLKKAETDLQSARVRVQQLDRSARAIHWSLAQKLGGGWDIYLKSLIQLLHFSSHTVENIRDAQGHLQNTWSIIIADGSVSRRERKRLIRSTQEVWHALWEAYELFEQMKLPTAVLERLGIQNQQELSPGRFEFAQADDDNIQSWMENVQSWIDSALVPYFAISRETVDVLLETEEMVLAWARAESVVGDAPAPAQVPSKYTTLVPGEERPRQKKLDWWDRFQVADGVFAEVLRFSVAAAILAVLIVFGV